MFAWEALGSFKKTGLVNKQIGSPTVNPRIFRVVIMGGHVISLKHMVLQRGSCATLLERCWVDGKRRKVIQRGFRRQVRDWTHCHLEFSLLYLGLLLLRPRWVVSKIRLLKQNLNQSNAEQNKKLNSFIQKSK